MVATFIFDRQLTAILVKTVNNQLSVKLEFETARLHLLKRFPGASVEFNNVIINSSPRFATEQFQSIETGILLKADRASFEFSLKDLLNKNYTIESISLNRGLLQLLTDSAGGVNYEIRSRTIQSNNDNIINLEKVNIRDLSVNYINKATGLIFSGTVENSKIKAHFDNKTFDLIITSVLTLEQFGVNTIKIHPDARFNADIKLSGKEGELIFDRSLIKFDDFSFNINGFIKPGESIFLKIEGNNIDLAKVKNYLPKTIAERYSEYVPGGKLKAECLLSGPMSRIQNPRANLKFSVMNGRILYKKSNIRLENLTLTGSYTNGVKAAPVTSKFELNKCSFNIGSADFITSLLIENFINPFIRFNLSGEVIPFEIQKFFQIPWLLSSEGSARINIKTEGYLPKKENYSISDFLLLNPMAIIQLKSFGIEHRNKKYSFANASGFLTIASSLWAEDLSFTYNNQRYIINGGFENFQDWITEKSDRIKINATINTGKINLSTIFPVVPDKEEKKNYGTKALKMPEGFETVLNLKAESIIWDKLEAENVNGLINYKPGILSVKDFSTDSFDGNIEGSFLLSEKEKSDGYFFQGNFSIKDVNIRECFQTFNNFGQNFIVSGNISGTLSGSLKMLMQFDTLFKPDIRSLHAEGKYIIENGALINFEPVKALSKFIKINELENISFSRLENDLFIRNNYLIIPQIDIFSSAADFTASGTHYFDNTFEYHIKAYLSELLSGKLRNNKFTSEFGSIEDDGLGRTSVFLKISGKGRDVKVSYDLRAARNKIRESLKNEKNKLKTILNEEYSSYKRDTVRISEPSAVPRFKIEWAETEDTVDISKDNVQQEKENIFEGIFKKRKNKNY